MRDPATFFVRQRRTQFIKISDSFGIGKKGGGMKRGEVRWYKFHHPDKKRPVVVLSRNSVLEYLGEVTVAPVTTTVRDIPSEVILTEEDGMSKNCAVNCDHLQTVTKAKIGALVTALSFEKLAQISKAVRFALDV